MEKSREKWIFAVVLFFLVWFLGGQGVQAEKLKKIATVDDFYDEVVKLVEDGGLQGKYYVLFEPTLISPQDIRGRAFEKGGYELEAKFSHWSYSWKDSTEGVIVSFKTGYMHTKWQDKQVRQVAEAIAKDCEGMTDYQKIKYVYDYIILNCEYDIAKDGAYNNLIVGKSCCNGYAEAFLTIMDAMHIPCQYTVNSTHAWNTVYLDGEWYNIDTTWGDSGGDTVNYAFFLKCNTDWGGMGPAQATAIRSYPVERLEHRIDYPNYTGKIKAKAASVVLGPIAAIVLFLYFLNGLRNHSTRRNIARNEETIRNLYKLPDE